MGERERCDSVGDSGDNMEEHVKRKREVLGEKEKWEGEREAIFRKSRKVGRSPMKTTEERGWKEVLKEMREEWRGGIMKVKQQIKEVAKGQKEMMKLEVERMKEMLREREESWGRERREIKEKLERMKLEMKSLMRTREEKERELRRERERKKRRRKRKKEGKEWKKRLRNMERRLEWKKRGERRRNFVLKGLKEGEAGVKEGVEEMLRRIGVEVRIEEVRKVEAGRMERESMVIVRIRDEKKKRVMRNKGKLKGSEM